MKFIKNRTRWLGWSQNDLLWNLLQGLAEHTFGFVLVDGGDVAFVFIYLPLPLLLWECSPALLSGHHELNILASPHRFNMKFLFWT